MPRLAATPGNTVSPEEMICGAENVVPFAEVTTFVTALVTPDQVAAFVPQVPAFWSSLQTTAPRYAPAGMLYVAYEPSPKETKALDRPTSATPGIRPRGTTARAREHGAFMGPAGAEGGNQRQIV